MAKCNDLNRIIKYIENKIDPYTVNEWFKTNISLLLNEHSKDEILKAVDIGFYKYIIIKNGHPTRESIEEFLGKISGIVYNNSLPEIDKKVNHIKNYGKSYINNWNSFKATNILKKYISALRNCGWSEEEILIDLSGEALEKTRECSYWDTWEQLFNGWILFLTPKKENIKEKLLVIKKEYNIIKEIDHGSFGKTYLCNEKRLDKKFVIKEFSCEEFEEDEKKKYFKKFIKEIVSLFDIHHQNIVSIYDYDVDLDNYSGKYVMEYIDGNNVKEYFTNNPNKVNDIFKQLINAFCYLESMNLCHRDIRIKNILVTKSGEAKLIDFGFVKNIVDNNSIHSTTKIICYPYDWPEEIIQLKSKYDIKTDIYFLGKLFEDLINNLKIKNFRYEEILLQMIEHSYDKRISSFCEIKDSINHIDYSN